MPARLQLIWVQIFRFISAVFSFFKSILGWILKQVFGSLSWQAPSWSLWSAAKLRQVANWIFATRKRALTIVLSALLGVGGSYYGWQWYQQLPKPVLTAYQVK
ncbi:MAG: hypothetical protein WC696_11135, partial [Candidatus Methylopumilus sp.]